MCLLTPATGNLGKWLVQLPLRCVLGLGYRSSRWIGLALWLSHLINWLRCCCPIHCFLGYPCSFFYFLSYLVCLEKCKLIILELKESFEDCFIVHRTNEPGPQGFIQWILYWLKDTGHCILLNSADKLLKCFSRFSLQIWPKFIPFSDYKSTWVELLFQELLNIIHAQIVDTFHRRLLNCQVTK